MRACLVMLDEDFSGTIPVDYPEHEFWLTHVKYGTCSMIIGDPVV